MRMRNVLPMECYSQDNKTFLPFRLITMKNNLLPEEGGVFYGLRENGGGGWVWRGNHRKIGIECP